MRPSLTSVLAAAAIVAVAVPAASAQEAGIDITSAPLRATVGLDPFALEVRQGGRIILRTAPELDGPGPLGFAVGAAAALRRPRREHGDRAATGR